MHRPNMVDTYQPKTVDCVTFCLVTQLLLITYFCKMSVNHGPRPIYDRLDGNCSIANLMFHAAILTLCANKRTLKFGEVVGRGHMVEHMPTLLHQLNEKPLLCVRPKTTVFWKEWKRMSFLSFQS